MTRFSWQSIFAIVRENKVALLWANLLAFFATLVNVPIPLLLPFLVDEVLLGKPGPVLPFLHSFFPVGWHSAVFYIGFITALILCLRFVYISFYVTHVKWFAEVAKDVVFRLRSLLLGRLQFVAMKEYETLGSGAVSSLLVNDLESIDGFLSAALSKAVIAGLSILGAAAILLWLNWQLALFILFLNPLVIYFTMRLGRHVKGLKRQENEAVSSFQQALSETLDAMQQIRAAQRDEFFFQRLSNLAFRLRNKATHYAWKNEGLSRVSFTSLLFGFDIFRAACMLFVVFSDLSVGQMFAIFGYLWFMMGPVQDILSLQYAFNSANAALQRVNQVFDLKQEPQLAGSPVALEGVSFSIAVQGLNFHYREGTPILKDVSLEIPAGQKVAFVGPSGSGKSTLIHVLLGLYEAVSGEILVDGRSVRAFGWPAVREQVGVVLQQPILFDDSVRLNLSLGQDVADEALWQALELAQLRSFVEGLADGLDTRIGRQGVRLSGGQRQRLAIARMILAEPKVVILDEATSALDAETEGKLFEALAEHFKDKTMIVIAHRLSAISYVDHIYVFDDGHLLEHGKHQELLANQQVYSRLYGVLQGV